MRLRGGRARNRRHATAAAAAATPPPPLVRVRARPSLLPRVGEKTATGVDVLINAGEPCVVCFKPLGAGEQQRLYRITAGRFVAVCCQEKGPKMSAPQPNILDRFTPESAWAKAAGKATYDRVHGAVVNKAAEIYAGLTPAERKAERADAGSK